MKKIAFLLSVLIAAPTMAVGVEERDNQTLVLIDDTTHQWTLDLDCPKSLDPQVEAEIKTSKQRIEAGKPVTVEQGRRTMRCTVMQYSVNMQVASL